MRISQNTELMVRGATTVGLGRWYSKQLVPRATNKLVLDDMMAMKRLRQRRLNITRIPSIYLSNLAQSTLGK